MLDQYNQDLNSDNPHLNEGRFQMSRRKVVFTLAGSSLALLFFLFIIGAFRSEEEITTNPEATGAMASELLDLQTRVDQLEKLVQGPKVIATKAQDPEVKNTPLTDDALKKLIAASTESQAVKEPIPYTPPETAQALEQIEKPAHAPQAAEPKTYVIQKGDTLSKVSKKFYGTTTKWKKIYDANRDKISNMNNLRVGTEIVIPE